MKKTFILLVSFFAPLATFAAEDVSDILSTLTPLLREVIPLLMTLAVIFFIIGVLKFILKAGTPEGRKEGFSTMIWGIIALFILVSFWGLVAILQNTFGIDGSLSVSIPSAH